MENTLRHLLSDIKAELVDFDEHMNASASAMQIAALQVASKSQLSYVLPAEYLELLAMHDGIDCNGIQLYASEPKIEDNGSGSPEYLKRGFVEANLIWRDYEPNKQYAFFAESGDKLYCHNLTADKFEIVDRVTKALIYKPSSFGTFNKLLEQLLNHMLDRYEVGETER